MSDPGIRIGVPVPSDDPVATLIRAARQARRWSIAHIAATAKVSATTVGRIEDGQHVSAATLAHVANALELTPDDLTAVGETEAAAALAYMRRHTAQSTTRQPPPPKPTTFEELLDRFEELQRRLDELIENCQRRDQ